MNGQLMSKQILDSFKATTSRDSMSHRIVVKAEVRLGVHQPRHMGMATCLSREASTGATCSANVGQFLHDSEVSVPHQCPATHPAASEG